MKFGAGALGSIPSTGTTTATNSNNKTRLICDILVISPKRFTVVYDLGHCIFPQGYVAFWQKWDLNTGFRSLSILHRNTIGICCHTRSLILSLLSVPFGICAALGEGGTLFQRLAVTKLPGTAILFHARFPPGRHFLSLPAMCISSQETWARWCCLGKTDNTFP